MAENLFPLMPRPKPDSIWSYKGKLYCVSTVLEKNLIQFNDEWYPAIRYTEHPQGEYVFYRALPDFIYKFQPA